MTDDDLWRRFCQVSHQHFINSSIETNWDVSDLLYSIWNCVWCNIPEEVSITNCWMCTNGTPQPTSEKVTECVPVSPSQSFREPHPTERELFSKSHWGHPRPLPKSEGLRNFMSAYLGRDCWACPWQRSHTGFAGTLSRRRRSHMWKPSLFPTKRSEMAARVK